MELYDVNNDFVKKLSEQVEQGIDDKGDFIDSFEQFKLSEEEFLKKNKTMNYAIANKKAKLKMIKSRKKDILKRLKRGE